VLTRKLDSFKVLMRGRAGIDETFGGLFARLNTLSARTRR
jgi:hypothetical protein